MEKQSMLIVDDSQLARTILKDIFDDEYTVIEASNGERALELLISRGNEISVMLLDMIMPEMDGIEVLKQMHRDVKLSQIPVVVTTSNRELELRALEFGVIDYIVKPYNEMMIKHRIDNVMAKIYLEKQKVEVAFLEEIRFAAEHDELTGLYNKRKFLLVTKKLLERNPDMEFTIICWKINRFHLITSVYGQEVATKLLMTMANFFLEYMQIPSTYARLEDDHFVCCVRKDKLLYERLVKKASKALNELSGSCPITLNLGIYEISDRTVSIDEMCELAQLPIVHKKNQETSQLYFYDEQAMEKRIFEQEMLDQMASGIKNDEFVVYLQPIIKINELKLASAEALVRWNHPKKGLILPKEFIPMFESNGFITQLDYYVWEKVCEYQRKRMDQKLEIIPISVNLSRKTIYGIDIAFRLSSLIQKYEIPYYCLQIEVTESVYMDSCELVVGKLKELKNLGFLIILDDFGSGSFSLHTLKDLPIDLLKIDMNFMENYDSTCRVGNVLSSLVQMGKWMCMSVMAECVETKAQMDFLKQIGCDKMQGFYYSKPLSQEEFEQYVINRLTEGSAEELSSSNVEENFQCCVQEISVQKQAEIIAQEQFEIARNQLNRVMTDIQKEEQTILIVDDEPMNRMILRNFLEDSYSILEATNGEEALYILRKHKKPVSLILLDLVMPVMDGYQCLKKLKEDISLKLIPVIVVSGTHDLHTETEVLKLGAIDLLKKPFTKVVIIQRVKKNIQLSQVVANASVNQSLINDMPCSMAVFAISDKIRLTFVSEWLAKAYHNNSVAEFLNQYEYNMMNLIFEEDRLWLEKKIKEAALNHQFIEEKVRIVIDEIPLWMLLRGRYVYSEEGEAFYYATIIEMS